MNAALRGQRLKGVLLKGLFSRLAWRNTLVAKKLCGVHSAKPQKARYVISPHYPMFSWPNDVHHPCLKINHVAGWGTEPGSREQYPYVLYRRDQVILNLLTPQSPPPSPFEPVIVGRIGEAAFQ